MLMLLRKTSKEVYLGNDIDVITHAKLGVNIPWACQLCKLLQPGQNVAMEPFLLDLTVR
jgi:hypothetical protein